MMFLKQKSFNKHLYKQCDCISRQFFTVSTWSPLAIAFNTKLSDDKLLEDAPLSRQVGLFEIPSLISYCGMHNVRETGIVNAEKLMKECCNKNRKRKLVQSFDDLSDCICQVADMSEFVRMMHPSIEFNQIAEETCIKMNGLVEKLNTNRDLYDCIKEVAEKGDKFPMTDVEENVVNLFMFDFEQSGIHLPKKERAMVVQYNDYILQSGQKFVNNGSQPRTIHKDAVPHSLHQYFNRTGDGDDILLINSFSDIPDEFGREFAYKVYLAPHPQQEKYLNEVLLYRHKLAQICGFPTFAHRVLRGSTAGDPEFVSEFLNLLNKKLRPKVEQEFNLMREAKSKESKQELAMWDVPYYIARLKANVLALNSNLYRPYFSLGACMEGLNNLFNKLFSITLVNEEVKPGETWSSDVYKLAVIHETEGLLGYIYCDFYERDYKPNQDCHYTIRGGRRKTDGSYQNPIVVVVLNLPAPEYNTPSLLSPTMVENLFHEMGHALHSMLGRTEYQHVTGTRCVTDFAEVPSILMEYFATDPRVVMTFAKHYKTQEPIPDELATRLRDSKALLSAADLQSQVFYSAIDHAYHTTESAAGHTTHILAEIQSEYYPIPYVANTAWQLKFSHLIGYGARYYSYLLSRAIASTIWQQCFRDEPFNREMGEKYRRECLAHGGGKQPRLLIKDFLHKEVTPNELTNSLIKEIGSVSNS